MNWKTERIFSKDWEFLKKVLAGDLHLEDDEWDNYETIYLYNGCCYGHLMCGALCFDIVLLNDDKAVRTYWLGAKAYLLGRTGYGYTENYTPYDYNGGVDLKVDLQNNYEDFIESLCKQLDKAVGNNKLWHKFAAKTRVTWEKEEQKMRERA